MHCMVHGVAESDLPEQLSLLPDRILLTFSLHFFLSPHSFQRIPIPSFLFSSFPEAIPFSLFSCQVVSDSVQPHGLQHTVSLSLTVSQSLLRFMSTESMMPSNHLILCCSLLLLPSILPIIRVFPSETAVCIRWPNYWSFSFSPSSEYSGLISFRMNWFDLKSHRFFIFCL